MRIYIYEEGFARFATEKYYVGQPYSKFMHLTNYAVNKINKNFVMNNDLLEDFVGSKWSLNALKKYFENIVKFFIFIFFIFFYRVLIGKKF